MPIEPQERSPTHSRIAPAPAAPPEHQEDLRKLGSQEAPTPVSGLGFHILLALIRMLLRLTVAAAAFSVLLRGATHWWDWLCDGQHIARVWPALPVAPPFLDPDSITLARMLIAVLASSLFAMSAWIAHALWRLGVTYTRQTFRELEHVEQIMLTRIRLQVRGRDALDELTPMSADHDEER